ncbi:MAG TPA: hypothetical protein VFD58_28035 [Blastocatellia bacterium]|nr:hypothetical protein [Blastocatellia bacterium]
MPVHKVLRKLDAIIDARPSRFLLTFIAALFAPFVLIVVIGDDLAIPGRAGLFWSFFALLLLLLLLLATGIGGLMYRRNASVGKGLSISTRPGSEGKR